MKSARSLSTMRVMAILILAFLSSCSVVQDQDLEAAVAATVRAAEIAVDTAEPTQEPEAQPPTEEPVVQEETPTASIVHVTLPDRPSASPLYLTDQSSADFAGERRTIGDAYVANIYERPFTTQTMDYQPYLDITRAQFGYTSPFFYVTIFLEEQPPQGVDARYGIEIDATQDGRGEWLVMGAVPSDATWTTDGVQAWHDTNGDVGGVVPLRMEPFDASRNGYDELIFDEGQGDDPDLAWIRRDPDHADRIQVAFKSAMIEPQITFLWLAWSDAYVNRPEWMDYNDHFAPEEAGSPAIIDDTYPLGAVASLDNTCRWAFGFTPNGSEPGVCTVILPTAEPGQPGRSGFRLCYTFGAQQICQCVDIPTCDPAVIGPCTPCTLP